MLKLLSMLSSPNIEYMQYMIAADARAQPNTFAFNLFHLFS